MMKRLEVPLVPKEHDKQRGGRRTLGGLLCLGAVAIVAVAAPSALASEAAVVGPLVVRHLEADPPFGHAKASVPAPAFAPAGASPWKALTNAPPFVPGTMLLQSDGTVLVHEEPETGATTAWYRLTPDSKGNYADGTWSKIASMPKGYAPLYFASAILPDGQMIVEGGEYNGTSPEGVWTDLGAIYNPAKNSWRSVSPPPGWENIGDAQSDVLANGTFMLSQACQNCLSENFTLTTDDALFNASGLGWTVIPGQGKNDPNDEEGWTLEPSGQLLTIDTWLTPTTELFAPNSLSWGSAGNTITSPVNSPEVEIGPQVELPGGNTFVVGAGTSSEEAPEPCTTHKPAATALYNYGLGKWEKGPSIPTTEGMQYDSADGPGSVLPDGNVLFDVSPCVYSAPLAFYLYNAESNSLSPVRDVRNAANDSTYYTRMLALPNGQVLFNDGSEEMEIYTAGGTPNPAWAPSIESVSSESLKPGQTASLSGTQLAGVDQGAAYGDDVQDNTNFPLVRITNSKSGVVTYARTSNWTSVSIAPGSASSTEFTVPKTTPAGASSLVVVANGIASQPAPVTIAH
jgi:hypothetical protein